MFQLAPLPCFSLGLLDFWLFECFQCRERSPPGRDLAQVSKQKNCLGGMAFHGLSWREKKLTSMGGQSRSRNSFNDYAHMHIYLHACMHCICMCVIYCAYLYVSMCFILVYLCLHVYICVPVCMCTHTCLYILCVCFCVHTCAYMCPCVHLCTCVAISACVCAHMHVHMVVCDWIIKTFRLEGRIWLD